MEKDKKDNDAGLWASKAFEALQRDGLPPVPDNFAVYYGYFSGNNPNLKMAMQALVDKFGGLDQRQCDELFRAHLSLEAENEVLKNASNNINSELQKVMGVINQTSSGTVQYGQSLSSFTGSLKDSDSMDSIKAAVEKIANETRIMADQNQRLQSQLSQSTQQLTEMRFNLDQVKKDSLIDPLTEVGNRKSFAIELQKAADEALENNATMSILMVDIDFFKKFNDTYGHLIGDQVLRLVARTLIENLKGRDVIARYGGEEFVIILPQTKVADAEKVANQLRNSLATKHIRRKNTNETLGTVTISLGAAEYCPHEDLDSLVARADAALYDAKQSGRNKVMSRVLSDFEIAVIKKKAENMIDVK